MYCCCGGRLYIGGPNLKYIVHHDALSVAPGYIGIMRRGARGTRKHVVATSAVFSVYDGISKIPAIIIIKDEFVFLRKSKIMRNNTPVSSVP